MSDIKNFLDSQGRLKLFPARRKMKIKALFYLAEKFDSKKVYSERQVNEILCEWHTFDDPATLRRELFGYGFLQRNPDGSEYRFVEPLPELNSQE